MNEEANGWWGFMGRQMGAISSVLIGILIFLIFPQTVGVPQLGSVYHFRYSSQRTVQEPSETIFALTDSAEFQIRILNISYLSSSYVVNYYGYDYTYSNYFRDRNETVTVISNLVHFDISTWDEDGNNRSLFTDIDLLPYHSPAYWCDLFVVNPDWNDHRQAWDASVEQIETNNCVVQELSTASNNGRGSFQFTIAVNSEGTRTIAGESMSVNGTETFNFASEYDSDGVLLNYYYGYSHHYYYEQHVKDITYAVSISRVSNLPLSAQLTPLLFFQIILSTIFLLVGLSIGFWIGVRRRGRTRNIRQLS